MKRRILACLLAVVMMLGMLPAFASAAGYTFDKDDITNALRGMGRMPSYYTFQAALAAEDKNPNPTRSEKITYGMYALWGFLAKYGYSYEGDKTILDVLDRDMYDVVVDYLWEVLQRHDGISPDYIMMLQNYVTTVPLGKLNGVQAPNTLLGVSTKDAMNLRVYTTTAVIGSDVDVKLNGVSIKNSIVSSRIIKPGATVDPTGAFANSGFEFYEHIVSLKPFATAGRQNVQVVVPTAQGGALVPDKVKFVTVTVNVPESAVAGDAVSTAQARVSKVAANKVNLGQVSTIKVLTNSKANIVKIMDSTRTKTLASTETEVRTNQYELMYGFPKAGYNTVYVYAGIKDATTGNITWYSGAKKLNVYVYKAAYTAKIYGVSVPKALRGTETTITVKTSKKTTRVKLTDSTKENVLDYTDDYTDKGSYRYFKLYYTSKNTDTSKVMYVHVGDDFDYNSSAKGIRAYFLRPTIGYSANSPRRGTNATIRVKASASVTKIELVDSTGAALAPAQTYPGSGTISFTWTSATKGKKAVYIRVTDSIGTVTYKKYVTFR